MHAFIHTYIHTYIYIIYKNRRAGEPDVVRWSRERRSEGERERGSEREREGRSGARHGRGKRSTPTTNSQKSVP
jgi:hypothetical protein